ncbi:hypothetical protein Elgi_74120 [Paenibacillus elgii]|uniref:hypothetical protein n=1 Tax=Paenibacillus elgii TaxID=189691 RepID=UPI002D7D07E4|nr:hypothetical protein Elgi_74120 [Paenibacillus elgii]
MTEIEKIKAFLSIKSFLNRNDQVDLINKLNLSKVDLDKRLKGKENEVELFLILHMLNSCNHILAFDEGTSVLTKSYSPDAIIELKNGYRFFLEIKSTDDRKFKNSTGNLENRIQFANSFGLPLYFAVKVSGYWSLYSAEYLLNNNGKIDVVDDFKTSEFYTMFGSHVIHFPEGFKAVRQYSRSTNKCIAKHDNHGFLVKYDLYFNNQLLFSFNPDSNDVFLYFMLESLNDAMLQQYQNITSVGSDDLIESLELKTGVYTTTHGMLLSPIYHLKHDLDFFYDSTTYYKDLLGKKPTHFTKEILYNVLFLLIGEGVPIRITTNKEL